MSAGSEAAPVNPGLVFSMMQAHQQTAALKAAIDLDVFAAVGAGPGDVASIARHAKASERGIRILCDFLVISGVLAKENGKYGIRRRVQLFLIRDRRHAWLRWRSSSALRRCWSLLRA